MYANFWLSRWCLYWRLALWAAPHLQHRIRLMLFRDHFYAGMAVLPFAIIGLISGHILSARKTGGALSVIHGICMLVGVVLACRAAYTGFAVLARVHG